MKRLLILLILLLLPLVVRAQGTAPVIEIVYSPDGTRAASLDTDGVVRVWAGDRPRLIARIAADAVGIALPDADTLVGLTRDGHVYAWDIETGEAAQIAHFETHADYFSFSDDAHWLAVSACTADVEPCPAFVLRLLDIAGGTLSDPLMTSVYPVTAIAFHLAGDLITVGTSDGNVVMLPIS